MNCKGSSQPGDQPAWCTLALSLCTARRCPNWYPPRRCIRRSPTAGTKLVGEILCAGFSRRGQYDADGTGEQPAFECGPPSATSASPARRRRAPHARW